jgi:hypothetical protein
MTRAQTAEKAARKGVLAVRRGVDRAKQAGVEAAAVAEQKLTERGIAPQQLASALAEGADVARKEAAKTTRRTRKKLVAKAKATRKDLAKAAKKARKDAGKARKKAKGSDLAKQAMATAKQLRADAKAAAVNAKKAKKENKRRKWPWMVGLAAVAAGAAYVLRSKPEPQAPEPKPAPKASDAPRPAAERNGQHVPSSPVSEKK